MLRSISSMICDFQSATDKGAGDAGGAGAGCCLWGVGEVGRTGTVITGFDDAGDAGASCCKACCGADLDHGTCEGSAKRRPGCSLGCGGMGIALGD